jgi:hypothetical protein
MKILSEKQTEDFLEKQCFNVVKRIIVKSKSQLSNINLEFPWVMKISSHKAIHKARIGGTILGIKNLKQAEKAFSKLIKIKAINGLIVQEMEKGQEIILGLKNTPEFGLAIMVGAGGGKVEEQKDISFRVCPIIETDAKEMLSELKINVRNSKEVIKNLIKLSSLAKKYPKINELDINPLIVNKKQAIVVDARMVIEK